jgi:hypothetical protein
VRYDNTANRGTAVNRRPAAQSNGSPKSIGDCCSRRSGPATVAVLGSSSRKVIVVMLLVLPVLESRAVAGLDADIPKANRAILTSGRWTPSAEETQKALVAIQVYLEKPGFEDEYMKGEIKEILKHAKEYRVQFVGVERDGKKYIWCNFFPVPPKGKEDHHPDWKRRKVFVLDGGCDYWRIECDPRTGKCDNFSSNGYA